MVNMIMQEKIKSIGLQILKEIIQICNKEDIEYFVIAGTALGAIRHRGFIPWDDDIDIGMTRKNYEKFLNVAPNELNEKFFLQTVLTDPMSPHYFAKVRRNNTKFIEYSVRNIDHHQGIYVDIFPFDKTPENNILKHIHNIKIKIYDYLFDKSSKREIYPESNNFLESSIYVRNKLTHNIIKFIPRITLFYLLDGERRKYNNMNQFTEYISPLNPPYCNKDCLFPVKKIMFEDCQVYAPHDCDTYLTYLYGDYMKLPPIQKRYGHMPIKVEIST